MNTAVDYDVAKMQADMAGKGWIATDLARKAKVSNPTVHRFFSGERRTARTALKFATALGQALERYIIRVESTPDEAGA